MTVFNHRFNPTVLREYDIRGIIGDTLKPEDAFAIGRCFGSVIVRNGGAKVAVGYDGRLSSPDLEPQLVAGLRACGLEVLRVGLVATPMLYYAAFALEADGAAMVTGSHNPPDYNGFKMMIGKKPFFGEQHPGDRPHGRRGRRGARLHRGQRPAGGHRRRLRRPGDARLRRRRPQAPRGVGPGQRLGLRRHQAARGEAAGRALRHQRHGGRHLPEPPPGPDGAEEPGAAHRRGGEAEGRSRHRLRRRRRPPRRGGRRGPCAVRRPADGGARARRAARQARRAPSSPT